MNKCLKQGKLSSNNSKIPDIKRQLMVFSRKPLVRSALQTLTNAVQSTITWLALKKNIVIWVTILDGSNGIIDAGAMNRHAIAMIMFPIVDSNEGNCRASTV